ncbi:MULTISPECIES: class I SAM-dependent methyltransferase [unclassified Nitratireductor]|uniref:class I SAM-dependent methyltransferase n=1 Tax=unclassified Nitratireductor TaxID=2641084 RepID=UPI0025D82A9C|nr:class I SAM-dependent methyltransferase [Nitratireductor sp.]
MPPSRMTATTPVEGYEERVTRQVPGLADMHRMAGILLAENVPQYGRVLVLGAGGGLELRNFARAYPGWRFDGIDPSADMLALAHTTLGDLQKRVTFHHGYIEDAPEKRFDGASCFLTLHFLPRAARLDTLRALHHRLKPGAPLVVAHHSFPIDTSAGERWLRRNARFHAASGEASNRVMAQIEAMRKSLPALPPEEDEALLQEAGFGDVELFYAAFSFRGWVCRALPVS